MHKQDILKNGLRIAIQPMSHMESVALGVWLRAGGRYEDTANNGISHLLEHLLFKGTLTRDMAAIKQEIEGRGGSFNGFTSEEYTCYLVKLLAKDIELGIDILSDMVLNPKLDQAEVDKEKSVIIEEINMYKDIPAQHVHEILTEMLWPGQPLGMPLAGSVESVKALTRKDVVAYKEAHYTPANMLLIGAGKAKEEDLAPLAEKYFSSIPMGAPSAYVKSCVTQKERALKVHTKQTEQTHVAIGFHTRDRFSPDRYALSLLNIILGANMSSRLFHIVRDEMALCYEISSSVRKHEDTGAFIVSAGVDTAKAPQAFEVIFRILAQMKKKAVAKEELHRAKEYFKGQFLFALEDTMSYMLWLGEKMAAGEKEYNVKKIVERIEAVDGDVILRVARDILRDDRLNVALIGPLKEDKALQEVAHIS